MLLVPWIWLARLKRPSPPTNGINGEPGWDRTNDHLIKSFVVGANESVRKRSFPVVFHCGSAQEPSPKLAKQPKHGCQLVASEGLPWHRERRRLARGQSQTYGQATSFG